MLSVGLVIIYFFSSLNTVKALADYEYKACWDVGLQDESMFCYGAITWPIDEENYYNAHKQDQKAKDMYRALLFKWYDKKAEMDEPSNNCLAIARAHFCTYNFPKCVSYKQAKQPLCTFMCDLFKMRCPEEDDFTCNEVSEEPKACSSARSNISKQTVSGILLAASII